jgi:MFS family permease
VNEAPAVSAAKERQTPNYSWYVLTVLFLVSLINYVDRQIISILAEDIKRDLVLQDEQIGFLFGTAFGVFYALFGIPFGRLADNWHRVRLMTAGLGLWSALTAMSGFASNGAWLAFARVGVGIGEATASPAAYSMLSDWFPKRLRATALSIYSAGLFVGAGLSLFIGGLVVQSWNHAYPQGGPLGLAGWQAAFLAVGLPGVALSAWVATLREPVRGAVEGLSEPPRHPAPFLAFLNDLLTIVPPLTLAGAARRGRRALAINVAGLAVIAAAVAALLAIGESAPQWIAVGIALYAVFSWGCALRHQDLPTFRLTIGSPAFVVTIISYGLTGFVATAAGFWTAPYALRELGVAPADAGLILGGGGALVGFAGVTIGGVLSDRLRRVNPGGRLIMLTASAILSALFVAVEFTADTPLIFYISYGGMAFFASWGLGSTAATTQDLVLPRMRGTATATFFIVTTLMGFALGPYLAGRISTLSGSLSTGMLALLVVSPFAVAAAIVAYRLVPKAEAQREAIARAAGEAI